MLAYLLWHRPREGVDQEAYEQAALRFHRSLHRAPPAGLRRCALLGVGSAPWLGGDGWYEDWYLLDDFCALGVLNEAAVAAGHRGAHDAIARLFGEGSAGVYRLLEGAGDALPLGHAIWVSRPAGAVAPPLGDMLGDGMDRERSSLWRRQLVLGPAPEYCVLSNEPPAGVSPARLPAGWRASALRRKVISEG